MRNFIAGVGDTAVLKKLAEVFTTEVLSRSDAAESSPISQDEKMSCLTAAHRLEMPRAFVQRLPYLSFALLETKDARGVKYILWRPLAESLSKDHQVQIEEWLCGGEVALVFVSGTTAELLDTILPTIEGARTGNPYPSRRSSVSVVLNSLSELERSVRLSAPSRADAIGHLRQRLKVWGTSSASEARSVPSGRPERSADETGDPARVGLSAPGVLVSHAPLRLPIIPASLLKAARTGELIPFVGAGMSSRVARSDGRKLPLWRELLEELVLFGEEEQPYLSDATGIRELISEGNLVGAAQSLQEALLPGTFAKYLQQTFGDVSVRPTSVHMLLPRISTRVLTTNYDGLLEGAFAQVNGGHLPLTLTPADLLARPCPIRSKQSFVFKVHGDYQRPSTIVLGSRDYERLLYESPGYRSFMDRVFAGHTILFVGFGGTDPDLDEILTRLSAVFGRGYDCHYILVPEGRFGEAEQKRLFRDKRLWVIEYPSDPGHTGVERYIEELARQTVSRD